jgi:hypothetical protein
MNGYMSGPNGHVYINGAWTEVACDVGMYSYNTWGAYGDNRDMQFWDTVKCSPYIQITTRAELIDPQSQALDASGPDVGPAYYTATSSAHHTKVASKDLREMRATSTYVLDHNIAAEWYYNAGCWLDSGDGRILHCQYGGAPFIGSPTVPDASCVAWPAPASCMFNPTPSASVDVTGTTRDGQTLIAKAGNTCNAVTTSQINPVGTCGSPYSAAYDWFRCDVNGQNCSAILTASPTSGELPDVHSPIGRVHAGPRPVLGTGSSYDLGHADVAHTIKVRATVYGPGGSAVADSTPSALVTALAPSNKTPPATTGVPQEGQTLVSDVGVWDGTPASSYAYQWRRCDGSGNGCVVIAGATGSSYVLVPGDTGATIRVAVTATNAAGSGQAISAQSPPVQGGFVAPTNTSPPTVTGTARDGQTLSASSGSWTRSPVTFAYQWQRCALGTCSDILGARAQTYTLGHDDAGATVRVVVTAVNSGGTGQAPSAETSTVTGLAPTNRVAPQIVGAPVVSQTLTANSGVWDGSGSIGYGYQWQRCDSSGNACAGIGANASTYTLVAADQGATIRVAVTAANATGSAPATSAQTTAVQSVPSAPQNNGLPSISGTARDGQTLSASTGSWTGAPVSYAYQWRSCNASGSGCADIAGAVQQTYALGHSDVGTTIRVQVTAVATGGVSSPATSAQTALVSALAPANTVAPGIVGAAVVGQTLMAHSGAWDGTPATYGYQWRRCDLNGNACVDIAGATDQTYTPTSSDVNAPIRVVVTATNSAASVQATSTQTWPVASPPSTAPPVNTARPVVSGWARDGQTLTAIFKGAWTNNPATYSYQWRRCDASGNGCADIPGELQQTYTLGHADVGATIRVTVTAVGTGGASAPATSSQTSAVEAVRPVNKVSPVIVGPAAQAQTLRGHPGSWDGSPATYTYQWLRCDSSGAGCASIPGATDQDYRPTAEDADMAIRLQVTATNGWTNSWGTVQAWSLQTAPVEVVSASPQNTESPTISGSAQHGQTLTATSGSWSHSPVSYAYQWRRCDTSGNSCADIAGAAQQTYALADADVGQTIRVTVTAANQHGTGQASSDHTAVVAAPPPVAGAGPTNTVSPQIAGVAHEGRSVTAHAGSWDGAQPITFAYQWRRCDDTAANCADVPGAGQSTYTVDHADAGTTLRVRVTASNGGGQAQADSSATPVIDGRFPAGTTISSPTEPVDSPLFGKLDPLSSGMSEQVPGVEQPDSSLAPKFAGWFDPPGSGAKFNAEMANGTPDPLYFGQVTVGDGRVFVGDGGSVHVYDAANHAYIATFPQTFGAGSKLGFYQHEVFVYDRAAHEFDVFDIDGKLKHRWPISPPQLPSPGAFADYGAISLAWKEIWATRYGCADAGAWIDIFDSTSGAYKGTTYSSIDGTNIVARTATTTDFSNAATPDPFNCAGNDRWWDISLVPELDATITNYRVLNRNPLLSALSLPDATALVPHQPLFGTSGGTDAVWGMRWLLTAPVVPAVGSGRATFGKQIDEYSLERDGQLGLTTATPKRHWTPKQPGTISDVAYRAHQAEIHATGPLMETDWLNATQCLDYVVTDGDFYILGRDGEHWYNLAPTEGVTLKVDDVVKATSTQPADHLCFDTTTVPSGVHILTLTAIVKGKALTTTNTKLHLDHDPPTGTLDALPYATNATVNATGTIADAHSGPKTWKLQVNGPGTSGNFQTVCTASAPDPAGVKWGCPWDTRTYQEGTFQVRALLEDQVEPARGGANTLPVGNATVIVDRTPPEFSHFAPALGEYGNETVEEVDSAVEWTQSDALSGVETTSIYYNAAGDRCDGDWRGIGTSSATGEATVPWNTAGVTNGLTCLRAVGRDRAGNTTDVRWQAILSAARFHRPTPGSTFSGTVETEDPKRNYAGQLVGTTPPARRGSAFRFTWGVSTSIKTPRAPQYFELDAVDPRPNPPHACCGVPAFTAHRVVNGDTNASGAVETGLITEGWCAPRYDPATGAQSTGWQEGWRIYGAKTSSAGVDGHSCPTGNLPVDTQWRVTTYVNGYLSQGRARIFGAMFWRDAARGSNQLIRADEEGARSVFRLLYRGGLQGQAETETYTADAKDPARQRKMDGSYSDLRLRKFPNGGGYPSPLQSEVTQVNDLHGFYATDDRDFGASRWLDFCTGGPFSRIPANPCDTY